MRHVAERLRPGGGDDIVATFGFDAGVIGECESMRSADGGGSEYLRMEVSGTGGTLAFWSSLTSPVYYSPRPFALPDRPHDGQRVQPDVPPLLPGASSLHAGNQALVRDLLAAVEADRPPLAGGHDARAALEMIMAVYASHVAGRRLALPLAERTHPLALNARKLGRSSKAEVGSFTGLNVTSGKEPGT